MIVTAISKDGLYLKIGEKLADSVWYGYDKEVAKMIKTINKGDEVEIKHHLNDEKKRELDFIKKVGVTSPVQKAEEVPAGIVPPVTTYKKPWVDYGSKTPEVQDSIRRQAIMHAVSRSLNSLQGLVTLDNIEEVTTRLYEHYTKLVTQ